MNTPPRSLLALLLIAPLLAGGCTLYANPSACKAQMREAVANAMPPGTLSISNDGVGVGGSRVVVEGTFETAAAATDASDAMVSKAADNPAAKPANPADKQADKNHEKLAAIECTFEGDKLTAMRWLSPPELANPASSASADAD